MDALSIKLNELREKYLAEGKHEVALGLAIALGESEILVPEIIKVHKGEAYEQGVDSGYSEGHSEGYDLGYDEGFSTGYAEGYQDGGVYNN